MKILCFGDSNTYGISPIDGKRLAVNERWPGILAEQLGSAHLVIEAGQPNKTLVKDPPFDGDKSGLKYLKTYLEEDLLDVIIIQLGTNDLKARFDLTPKQVTDGLERLLTDIKNNYKQVGKPTKVVILSPVKVIATGQYQTIYKGAEQKSQALVAYFSELSKNYQCEFIDCYSFIEPCKKEGVHLHCREHKMLAKAVYKMLTI